jgi:hypothetical protein
MSIFSSILEKLGIHKDDKSASSPEKFGKDAAPYPRPIFNKDNLAPMAMVDVASKLDALAKKSPIQLDWKVSIVDLLVLLGIDHSAASINQLAVELGCPASEMSDSARRNIWLHKTVMQKLADNGGNIPPGLLHR